jgi:hypothetical protein
VCARLCVKLQRAAMKLWAFLAGALAAAGISILPLACGGSGSAPGFPFRRLRCRRCECRRAWRSVLHPLFPS